ncbi:SAM hydrolase/SAM-dependent halogenase family protein [Natronobiforma cellulositropha]|uniref:SAM hydrolase/SAM-dependent halogenase family protein n=1 Tax=Natronobiforma cellulositropha TaxID=1679076 RepID=UPI0021D60EE8|nr:SAM-dependent chlorinase/fluorinase [Natronobiforma cellulositropha]
MITLASDFGTPYPAAMKGVILARTETPVDLVDVAHDFPRGDVRTAAFWLREVLPYFPPAVHLAVVDPGVGTDRNALVIRAGEHALVGPDNGVLLPAARRLLEASETDALSAFTIDDSSAESATFHGRDVFAPAAAAVHEAGVDALETVPSLTPVPSVVDLTIPDARLEETGATGEVLVVDDFGNVVTNVPGAVLEGREDVRVDGQRVPVGETFAAVPPGEKLATVGSHGFVELDVNDGRGDEAFSLAPGEVVRLEWPI